MLALLASPCLAGCLAIAPDPAQIDPPATASGASVERGAKRPRARGRERAIAIAAGTAAYGGLGLALLVPSQAVRYARDRRLAGRCIQQGAEAEAEATSDGVDPASACFGRARHPLGVASLAVLGALGGAVIVGGAAQIGAQLGKLARTDGEPRRVAPRLAVGATLAAVGGATILVAAPVLFAYQRRRPLHEHPRWQGARFLATDAGIIVGAIGVGLLTHAIARRARVRTGRVQVHPTLGLRGAGVTLAMRW